MSCICLYWFAAKDCSVSCSAYCVKFVFYPSPSLGRQVNILKTDLSTQLSPAIILMSGGVHEGGMLQSDLFTRRSQNLVSGKLRRSGFWRYGQFFKCNRVKMAKNGFKMVEFFGGASHIINDYVFNNFALTPKT